MNSDFLDKIKISVRKKPVFSILFFATYLVLIVFWRRNLPPWKVYPFLLVVFVTFLFLIVSERRTITMKYCKISLIVFLIFLIAGVIINQFTSNPITLKILYIIALNLKLSVFLVFLRDIIFANSIEYIVKRKWYHIITGIVLLWIYVSWIFAIAYSHPSLGCVCTETQSNFDSTNSINNWYFSITTITTVGYGDFYPTGLCKVIANIEMLLGFFLISVMAGLVAGAAYEEIKRKGHFEE
ncbi:hypothetical protein DRN45_05945 [Thermococci archaeon]|nr:MAG: hypothetical protein DRN45_05945 [Thermococci archaeon]